MEPWVLFALAAASIQIARTTLQKNMTARLSVRGATYARYFYGLPLALALFAAVTFALDMPLPTPRPIFFVYAPIAAFTQVVSSAMFIHLLTHANFAISGTFIKTETVLTAVFSFLVLGDVVSPLGGAGILITMMGCMVLAAGREHLSLRTFFTALGKRAAVQGIAIGAIYAFTSTFQRASTLSLDGGTPMLNAVYALAVLTFLQMTGFGLYLLIREGPVVREVVRAWRPGFLIGLTAIGASACWYTAFAQKETAYVLAVGNIDLVLAYLISRFYYREHTTPMEIAGMVITVIGVLAVVFAR